MQSDYGSWPRVCLRLPWLPRIRKNLIELLCMRAGEYLDQAGTLEITQLLIANAEKKELTCSRFSGPKIAGKFQFSGISDSGRWTRNGHEAIEIHGGTDCLHFAAG